MKHIKVFEEFVNESKKPIVGYSNYHDGTLNDHGWLSEAQRDKKVDHIEKIEIKDKKDSETEEELLQYADDKKENCPRCGAKFKNCKCQNEDPWSTQNFHRVPKGKLEKKEPKQNFKNE